MGEPVAHPLERARVTPNEGGIARGSVDQHLRCQQVKPGTVDLRRGTIAQLEIECRPGDLDRREACRVGVPRGGRGPQPA